LDRNDHPNIIIGQATLGVEILEDVMNIDALILPTEVDDCELTAGIATAIKEVNLNIMIFVSEQVLFIIGHYCLTIQFNGLSKLFRERNLFTIK